MFDIKKRNRKCALSNVFYWYEIFSMKLTELNKLIYLTNIYILFVADFSSKLIIVHDINLLR